MLVDEWWELEPLDQWREFHIGSELSE